MHSFALNMKKPLIISALLTASLSVYSQGTLFPIDHQPDVTMHIYAPQLANPSQEVSGDANASTGVGADLYANNGVDGNYAGGSTQGAGATGFITTGGSTVYTGGALENLNAGNPTPAGAYNYNNGADYTVQLYAAVGANQPLTALLPVSQYKGLFRNVLVVFHWPIWLFCVRITPFS